MASIRHFGLVVKDMDNALRFYRDILGLHKKHSAIEYGDFIDNALGQENVEVETLKMCDDNDGVLIELLKFNNPTTISRAESTTVTIGASHIAFTVDSIETIFQKLIANNVRVFGEPKESPDGNVMMTYCRDFEGNLIELVQPIENHRNAQ